MIFSFSNRIALAGLLYVTVSWTSAQVPKSQPYVWKSVQMVGAGFVDGIVYHPTAKNVRYARTDMGGAYRWDTKSKRWSPILDWVPYKDLNFMGVESIALDPTDPKRVYLACGTYTNPSTPNGAILRSKDGGRTFDITRVPFKFGGNENGRGNGERMTVDPNDPRNLYLGTRHDGLWRSSDKAITWKKVESFPWTPPASSVGVVVTLVDGRMGKRGLPSNTIYAAVSDPQGPNIFASHDAGTNWAPLPGTPLGLVPTHMIQAKDGALWLSYSTSPGPNGPMTSGAIWKWKDGVWTNITPEKPGATNPFGYVSVAVQADRPDTAIVSTFFHKGGEQIFRTIDGGKTWTPTIGGRETYDAKAAPYQARTGIHWLFDIEIDPKDPNHAMFTTGYGGHETFNLSDADRGKPVIWHALAPGIEESVALQLFSPTQGVPLMTAIGDYGGGVFADLDKPLPQGSYVNPAFGNTDGVAGGDLAPNIVVRVGRPSNFDSRVGIGYSTDGGKTWQPAGVPRPRATGGHIAVSADGSTWIWSLREGAFLTMDRGKTWIQSENIPAGVRIAADRIDPNRFYGLDLFAGNLYESSDAGLHFLAKPLELPNGIPSRGGDRGDNRGGQDQVYAAPGRAGDLWIAAADGLYHSTDGNQWTSIPHVEVLHAFGFGMGEPGNSNPSLYMVGTISGQRGIFRSDDLGQSWFRINDEAHQWGLILQITGDPKRYGRVYVGTHGRGVFYGDIK